jgi:hypothetical protein
MPGTSIELRVYTNVDDATIVWQTGARIPGCRGFALDRRARDAKLGAGPA